MARPPATKPRQLEAALDALYASSPKEFTVARKALAKELAAAGDDAGAATVGQQRKPTLIAYVLNQLARRQAAELADLVDAGRELARAQRKALRGEAGDALREAIARQRVVVTELTAKTAALMKELGVGATGHLDEIAGALQAALVDPVVGEALEEGRLQAVPERAAGFPGASLTHVSSPPKKQPTERAAKEKAPSKAALAKKAAAEKADARRAAAEKAAAAKKAELGEKADALEAKANRLTAEAERATSAARLARRAADDA